MSTTPHVPRRRAFFGGLSTVLCLVALACGSSGSQAGDSALEREVFVATYVDLRVTALTGDGELTDAQRSEVLARHGVTEDDLTGFAEAHGPDLPYMRDVWNDIEARLDATRSRPDSASSP